LKNFLFIFLLIFSGEIQSQSLTYQSFDQKSGLKSLDIHCIIQDKYGYVWIASDKGLSMWDSKNFTHFTVEDGLENDNVFKLYEDGQGRLWIVSFSKKLCYYSYKDKKIYNSSRVKYLDKINVNLNTDLILKDNKLFYFSNEHTFLIKYFHFVTLKDSTYKKTITPELLFLFNDSLNYSDYDIRQSGNKYFLNSKMDSFNLFYKDYRYVYGINHKTKIFDRYTNTIENRENKDLMFFFKKGVLNIKNELYYNKLLIDKDIYRTEVISKNLCFFFKKDKIGLFTNYNTICKQKKGIKTIIVKNKNIYTIDDDNNFWKDNTLIEVLNPSKTLFYNTIQNKENVYFMYSNSLYSYKLNKLKKSYKFILPTHLVGKYFYIKDSTYLLSTHVGLFYKKEKNYNRVYGDRVYATFINSKKQMWHTTLDGIYVVDSFEQGNRARKKILFKESKKVFVNEYLEDANGNMIMASNIGLIIMDSVLNYTVLSDKNYLTSMDCKKVKIDPIDSSLWIVTSEGLNNIKYSFNNKKLQVKVVNHFLEIDGLNSNEINDIDFEDSAIYVANKKGLNKIINRFEVPEAQEIPLYIKNLYVNKKWTDASKPLDLKFDENSLKLEISPIYFERRERLRTQVKLYKDKNVVFSQLINNEEIDFVSLSSGSYRLELSSYDIDYPYVKSKINKLEFVINPPFYKTWWFISFLVGLVLGVFYYVLDKRRQSALLLAKLNKSTLNSLQNQMNPHFVFNSMQTIQNLLLEKETESSLDYISDFSNLLRSMLEHSRNEIINLEDEIDFLKKYIKLEKIRFKNKFEVQWDIDLQDESIEEIYIPTMLIQPLIENAIKYSSSESSNVILIQVQIEVNFLIVCITNPYDSRFVRTSKHKSTALTVIKERLKLYSKNNIEGRFELDIQQSKAVACIYIPI
jgi:hypothetical protein